MFTYFDVIIIIFDIVDMANPSMNINEIGKKQSLSSSLIVLKISKFFVFEINKSFV